MRPPRSLLSLCALCVLLFHVFSIGMNARAEMAAAPAATPSISSTQAVTSSSVPVPALQLDHPMSFRNDVMPVLTKAGCNTGACHGAARGRDGFHLSLFGYDPDGDYDRITREMGARRINLALTLDDSRLTGMSQAVSGNNVLETGT